MTKKPGRLALGLGLVSGALAGLLFAPESGKEIRKKISEGDTKGLLQDLTKMGDELGSMVTEFIERPHVQDVLDQAKDKAAEAADMQREELDAMLARVNKKTDDFKKVAKKYVDEQKKALASTGKTKKSASTSKKKSTSKKASPVKKKSASKSATTKKPSAKKPAPKKKK